MKKPERTDSFVWECEDGAVLIPAPTKRDGSGPPVAPIEPQLTVTLDRSLEFDIYRDPEGYQRAVDQSVTEILAMAAHLAKTRDAATD